MSIESTAIRDGDSYIVNANKIFVTNGGVADTLIIFVSVNPGDVKKGFSAILVERGTPGFEVGLLENNCGIRANPVSSIVLTDCRVPRANLLGREGDGFKIAMAGLDTGRVGIAAQAVGIAQAALDVSLKYAKERIQFRVPIARHQAIQMMLADMGTMVEAATASDLASRPYQGSGRRSVRSFCDGQALCRPDGFESGLHGRADPRRLRIQQGVPDRALFPGRPGDRDL